MVIKTISEFKVLCVCDNCGKEFELPKHKLINSKTGKLKLHHYCSKKCSDRISYQKCIICKKPYDDNFYDKSKYRPICSKECYSAYLDNRGSLVHKNTNPLSDIKEKPYEYYRRGRLVLANYKL